MVLVDTTVWIDFFANRPESHVELLTDLIESEDDVCISGVILAEVLQGVPHDRQFKQIREYFQPLLYLPTSRTTYLRSAEIYRSLRRRGVTIRKSIDCIIAATVIESGVELLHNDRDFDFIAAHTGLNVYTGTGSYPLN